MDLSNAITMLHAEKKKLDRVILSLEGVAGATSAVGFGRKRRGRKSMSAAERLEVSARMKRYWAERRQAG